MEEGTEIVETEGPFVSKACTYLLLNPTREFGSTAIVFNALFFAPPDVLIDKSTFLYYYQE